jgi:hypothetical protein
MFSIYFVEIDQKSCLYTWIDWTSKTTWIENIGIFWNFYSFLCYLKNFNEIKSFNAWIDPFRWRPERDNRDLVVSFSIVLVCSAWCFCFVGGLISLYTYIDRLCKIFDYVTSACGAFYTFRTVRHFSF